MKKLPYLIEFIPKKVFDEIPENYEELENIFVESCQTHDKERVQNIVMLSPVVLEQEELNRFGSLLLNLYEHLHSVWRWFSENFYFVSLYYSVSKLDYNSTKELLEYAETKLDVFNVDRDKFTKNFYTTLILWFIDPRKTQIREFLYRVCDHNLPAITSLLCLSETSEV